MDGLEIVAEQREHWRKTAHVDWSLLVTAIDDALSVKEAEIAKLKAERQSLVESSLRLTYMRDEAEKELAALRAERDRSALVNTENDWMLSRLVSIAEAFQYPQDDVKDFDQVKAVLDVLCERDDMMRLYRVEHERHTATLAQMEALRADLRAVVEAECALRDHCELCDDCNSMDTPCDVSVELQESLTKALARPGVVGLDTGATALVE